MSRRESFLLSLQTMRRVDPSSDPAAIRAWVDELEGLRRQHDNDESAVDLIDEEVARAISWLQSLEDLPDPSA